MNEEITIEQNKL